MIYLEAFVILQFENSSNKILDKCSKIEMLNQRKGSGYTFLPSKQKGLENYDNKDE